MLGDVCRAHKTSTLTSEMDRHLSSIWMVSVLGDVPIMYSISTARIRSQFVLEEVSRGSEYSTMCMLDMELAQSLLILTGIFE